MTAYGILTDAVDPNTLLTHADISLDVAGDIVTELRRIQMEWMKGFENGDYNPNSQAFTGLNVLIGAQQGMSVMNCSTWGERDDSGVLARDEWIHIIQTDGGTLLACITKG